MTERYWDIGDGSDELRDFVNENVISALKDCWEDDPPVLWAEGNDDRIVIVVGGPGKPTQEDPSGQRDIFSLRVDLFAELTNFGDPYDGRAYSEAQKEDIQERTVLLSKLAEDIAGLVASLRVMTK